MIISYSEYPRNCVRAAVYMFDGKINVSVCSADLDGILEKRYGD